MTEGSTAADRAIIEVLWPKVARHEAEPGDHQRLLDAATRADALPDLARRYRDLRDGLEEDDSRREALDQRLRAIALVAMTTLDAQRTRATQVPRVSRILTAVVAVVSFAAVTLLFYLLLKG